MRAGSSAPRFPGGGGQTEAHPLESLALWLRSIVEQGDCPRMHEIPGVCHLSREEQRFSRPQAPLLTRKGEELQRLARKEIKWTSSREPCDVVVERHPARPVGVAAATSL